MVQKYAEPTHAAYLKKVGRRGLPEPIPNGKPGLLLPRYVS